MMTKDGGRRIATSTGAVLADERSVGSLTSPSPESLFEPAFWAARRELADVAAGRGAAWFVAESGRWVLRHYRRGGWVSRWSTDRYLWGGESRVRSFAEWRLLAFLNSRGLPVPKPVAARYRRAGPWYRCDLITERIAGAQPLSAVLMQAPLTEGVWRGIGAAVARLHAAGADHADLNAHNILVSDAGAISVIDFDRGRLRMPGAGRAWAGSNLQRLHRSLVKIARLMPPDRFTAAAWDWLLAGYRALPV
jgi:3-deoxy-D-manno-octulosonic acid kinase